ncbi:MAG TPA: endonuclease/exonuclease/phosphatase family protein [Terriglobales bacterium]
MPKLRIGTFNCENLFARYNFNSNVDPAKAIKNGGFDVNMTRFDILSETEKKLTAKAIEALDADVLALQEVENFDVLKRFRNERLKNLKYEYAILVDGNDPRKIDVALLSRYPIVAVRSFQHMRDGKGYLFSRDCLEADVQVDGKTVTLFINHLKSMLDKKHPADGRKNTRAKRAKQAAAVKKIIEQRFGQNPGSKDWVVMGDFNDYLGKGQGTTSGVTDLVTWPEVENVVDRLPESERWTHFFDGAPKGEVRTRQLDYILLSSALAERARSKMPVIVRKGLSTKATEVTEPRFKGVTNKSEASDHCPVAIDVEL